MSRLKGKQIRKYKKSCNRYYKILGKKKKAGILKPVKRKKHISKEKKSFLDYLLK